jgi:WhiB family redox-sensing transcriptional regulator
VTVDDRELLVDLLHDIVTNWGAEGAWRSRAACRGESPGTFWPGRGDLAAFERAVAFCGRCPVRDECRGYADDRNENQGVWGGESGRVRRRRKREQKETTQ